MKFGSLSQTFYWISTAYEIAKPEIKRRAICEIRIAINKCSRHFGGILPDRRLVGMAFRDPNGVIVVLDPDNLAFYGSETDITNQLFDELIIQRAAELELSRRCRDWMRARGYFGIPTKEGIILLGAALGYLFIHAFGRKRK